MNNDAKLINEQYEKVGKAEKFSQWQSVYLIKDGRSGQKVPVTIVSPGGKSHSSPQSLGDMFAKTQVQYYLVTDGHFDSPEGQTMSIYSVPADQLTSQ